MNRSILLLPLLTLIGCGGRDEPRMSPSAPAPAPVVQQMAPPLAVETRRAMIVQRLAKHQFGEVLRNRLVEGWVAGSDGFDQAAMDRLLVAIDGSIAAGDENRFNATKDLAGGRDAVAGSTLMGALISGMVADGAGRMPIAVDCGGIRANGWVERSGARANRATVIITSLSVHETTGRNVTYQHPEGLAYLMGPDGMEGLTLQPVTDQRGNSWLGLRAGTLVTLILIRAVDQSLMAGNQIAPGGATVPEKPGPAAGKAGDAAAPEKAPAATTPASKEKGPF